MGSPIVAGRIMSPGSPGPTSLPYEVPIHGSNNSGNGIVDKSRTRSITESSASSSSSRGPVSKVMDMFRHRSQSMSTSDDKRKVID